VVDSNKKEWEEERKRRIEDWSKIEKFNRKFNKKFKIKI
jgi:hypothetical protein